MNKTFHHRESNGYSFGFICKELLLKFLLLTSLLLVGCNGEVAQQEDETTATASGAEATPTPTPTPTATVVPAIVFPDNMTVTYDDNTKFISFSWTMVASPLEMAKVEITKVSTGVKVLDQNTLNGGAINLGPLLEDGTLYNYRVYASDITAALSTNYLQGQFETAPPPPPAPPAPTAPSLFNNAGLVYNDLLKKATVSWDTPVEFVVGRVEIRDSGNTVQLDANVLNGGTLDLSGLAAGEAHTWKIWAVEPVGGLNSVANVSGGFNTGGGVTAPSLPPGLNVAYNQSGNFVTVKWTATGESLIANFILKDSVPTTLLTTAVPNGGSIDLGSLGLADATNYDYEVSVTDMSSTLTSASFLSGSLTTNFGGVPTAPPLPGDIAGTYDGQNKFFSVDWTATPELLIARVEIRRNSDSLLIVDTTVAHKGSLDLSALVAENTLYDYNIWTINPANVAPNRESATFHSGQFTTPPDPPPPGLTPFPANMIVTYDKATKFITLTWDELSDKTLLAQIVIKDSLLATVKDTTVLRGGSVNLVADVIDNENYTYEVFITDLATSTPAATTHTGGFDTNVAAASPLNIPIVPILANMTTDEGTPVSQSGSCMIDLGAGPIVDPQGQIVITSGPSWAYVTGTDTINLNPNHDVTTHAEVAKVITITYNCISNITVGSPQSFTITVNDIDQAPQFIAKIESDSAVEGATTNSLDMECVDPDFEDTAIMSEQTAGLPGWISFDSLNGRYTYTPGYSVVGNDANGIPYSNASFTLTYRCSANSVNVQNSFDLVVDNTYHSVVFTGAVEWDGTRTFYVDPGANLGAQTFTRDCYNDIITTGLTNITADQSVALTPAAALSVGSPSTTLNFDDVAGLPEGYSLVEGAEYTTSCNEIPGVTAIKTVTGDIGTIPYTKIQNCNYTNSGAGQVAGTITVSCEYYQGTAQCGAPQVSNTNYNINNKAYLDVSSVTATTTPGATGITLNGAPTAPDDLGSTWAVSFSNNNYFNNVPAYNGSSTPVSQNGGVNIDDGASFDLKVTLADACGNSKEVDTLIFNKNFLSPEVKALNLDGYGDTYGHCAIMSDDSLKCWGRGEYGQTGNGAATHYGDAEQEVNSQYLPTVNLGTGRTAKQVSRGYHHTCAILDNDQVKCWGRNNYGQLGLGSTQQIDISAEMGDALPYVNLGTGRTAKKVTLGAYHSCALLDNDQVKCWGYNTNAELGQGHTANLGDGANEMGDFLAPIDFGTGLTPIDIDAGVNFACALFSNKKVKCWGYNANGELGYEDTNNRGNVLGEMGDNLPFVNVGTYDGSTFRNVDKLRVGQNTSCVQFDDGEWKCWGYNGYGGLAEGNTASRGDGPNEMGDNRPLLDVGLSPGQSILDVQLGYHHGCALISDYSMKCWGYNNVGQIGWESASHYGDNTNEVGTNMPTVDIGTYKNSSVRLRTKQMSLGYSTCALVDNGYVKCFGNNSYGALGINHTTHRGDGVNEMGNNLDYVRLFDTNMISVTKLFDAGANNWHMCAILADNTVKCWGWNGNGQLGIGNTNTMGWGAETMHDSLPRVELGLPSGEWPVDGTVGNAHSCVLTNLGNVKCWGYNGYGQLGHGNTTQLGDGYGEMGYDLPYVNLGAGRTATDITASANGTCVILDNGSVKCWGRNNYGQSGIDATTQYGDGAGETGDAIPNALLGATAATQIDCQEYSCCALLADNTIKCWGYNGNGNLGHNDTVTRGDGAGEMAALPLTAHGLGTITKIVSGYRHTCAVDNTGAGKCWGYGNAGRLGQDSASNWGSNNTTLAMASLPPIALTGATIKDFSVGVGETCAITNTNRVRCWGANWYGQSMTENQTQYGDAVGEMATLVDIEHGINPSTSQQYQTTQIEGGYYFICGIFDDGKVRCWGNNRYYNGSAWSSPYGMLGYENSGTYRWGISVGHKNSTRVTPLGTVPQTFNYVAP